jgi:hypothetical protein
MDTATVSKIRSNELTIQESQLRGEQAALAESSNNSLIAQQKLKLGGGCAGKIEDEEEDNPENELRSQEGREKADRNKWKWKQGICRVSSCPTRPGATKIGPCAVCENCQHQFDRGVDPTKAKPAIQPALNVEEVYSFLASQDKKGERQLQHV